MKDKRQIQVSVEVEKPREELYQLFGYGDVFKKKKKERQRQEQGVENFKKSDL